MIAAAYVGYQGSRSIHENAQELVRGHFVVSGRGAELEAEIEKRSQELLDELEMVLGVCLVLTFGCAAATVFSTRRAFRRLEWQAEELDRVSWQMLQDQEVVARRFSHEMHDELGQSLTGLKSMLKRMKGPGFVENRVECLEILDGVLANVRELSQLLRPMILDDFGLDAGLRWLTERFSERTQISADYTSHSPKRLSDDQETHLFRIAQEALTNIARHSGATEAKVRPDTTGDRVLLRIEDNGRGMPAEAQTKPSLGMVGMRARARHVGGVFEKRIRKQADCAWRFKLRRVILPRRTAVPRMNKKTRILLADDHTVVRKGIRMILSAQPDLEVVAAAKNGLEAVSEAERTLPDVVIMDVNMESLNGIEAARRIAEISPRTRVLALSMHRDAVYVRKMLRAGAKGYLVKDADDDALLDAVRAVARGEAYLSPSVAEAVLTDYRKHVTNPVDLLTSREREVLQLIAEGSTNKDIANQLSLSVYTVEGHRSRLMEKLNLHSTGDLVRFAIRNGFIS